MAKPYYTIKLQLYGCNFDVKINNVSALQNVDGFGISTKLPINSFIKNGKNEIEIHLRPIDGQVQLDTNANCNISIQFSNDNSEENIKNDVFVYSAPQFTIEKPQLAFTHKTFFDVDVPFDDSIWFKGTLLERLPDVKSLLFQEYEAIYYLLLKSDINEILELMNLKHKEIAECLYIPVKEINESISKALNTNLNSKKWELMNMDKKEIEIVFLGYGRLAKLINKEGFSPIFFEDKENDLVSAYEFMFCYKTDLQKFVIIR